MCVIERKREERDTGRQTYRHKKREGKEKNIETILKFCCKLVYLEREKGEFIKFTEMLLTTL